MLTHVFALVIFLHHPDIGISVLTPVALFETEAECWLAVARYAKVVEQREAEIRAAGVDDISGLCVPAELGGDKI